MPTITANTSTQIALSAGRDISGTGAGSALVGNGAAGAIPLTNGSPWQIGPFLTAQTVHITAASAITYAVEDPLADPVRFTAPQVAATQALVSGVGIPGAPLRLPYVLSAPPAVSLSAGGAATGIASSITILPDEPGAFSYYGGPAASEGGSYRVLNKPTTTGATAHGGVDFWFDTVDATGRIELLLRGSSASTIVGLRVAVQQPGGDWGYITAGPTFATAASDGLIYRGLVTLAAAGRYRLRIEMSSSTHFAGVSIAPTDSVFAAGEPPFRYMAFTDSYGNTISDSGTRHEGGDNWVNYLRYLTGYDIVCSSIGGSGYVPAGSGVKAADHILADIAAAPPLDGVIFAFGYNDYNTGGIVTADVATQAAACIALVRSVVPAADIVMVGPWAVKGLHTSSVTRALGVNEALRAVAAAAGVKYLDILSLPVPDLNNAEWSDVTSTAITGGVSTTVTVGSAPEPFASGGTLAGRTGWYVTIIDGDSTETRKVTSMGTVNPRTLTTAAWGFSHAAGVRVEIGGPSWITGTGRQGATVGDGNADRYIGGDAVHPTVAGQRALAMVVHDLWSRA